MSDLTSSASGPSICPVAHSIPSGSSAMAAGRADDGYFGPESVSWRVFADPSANTWRRRLHAVSTWTDPKTGEELRADNEEWPAWTNNCVVFGVLRAAEAFGPELTAKEEDQFIAESK